MVNQLQTNRYFSAPLLPSVDCFKKNQKLRLEAKNLVMRPNIQNDNQQWYQWPQQLILRVSDLITRSTDWVYYWWLIRFIENWQITKVVRPPSLWQTNVQIYRYVSAYLLPLIFFDWTQFNVFYGYVWLIG